MILKRKFPRFNLWIFFFSYFLVTFFVPSVHSADRVALVIGNSNYKYASNLANPVNDADAVSASLVRLDFEVMLAKNLRKTAFEQKLMQFSNQTNGVKIALVYYAGHGLECNGQNYLIPIDAGLKFDKHIQFECISLEDILSTVEGAKVLKLILLDACRNNPFIANMRRSGGTRSIGRGLARVETRPGVLISYAAAAGTTADDGNGRHSPYTEGLLNYLEQPGLEINLLFREVAAYVQKKTNGRQIPFEYGRLPSKGIYLKTSLVAPSKKSTLSPSDDQSCRDAAKNWDEIKTSQNKALYEEHLRLFGNCAFASLARHRLDAETKRTNIPDYDLKIITERLRGKVDGTGLRVGVGDSIDSYHSFGGTIERKRNLRSALKMFALELQKAMIVGIIEDKESVYDVLGSLNLASRKVGKYAGISANFCYYIRPVKKFVLDIPERQKGFNNFIEMVGGPEYVETCEKSWDFGKMLRNLLGD